MLVPGQTQTYKATFRIFSSWASDADASGSSTGKRKVRVRLSSPKYLEFRAEAATLLSDDAGSGAVSSDGGIAPDNSNADFEDFTEEEWEEFIEFLLLLLILYSADSEDWPETQINVLDSGLALQNIDDMHDGKTLTALRVGPATEKEPMVAMALAGETALLLIELLIPATTTLLADCFSDDESKALGARAFATFAYLVQQLPSEHTSVIGFCGTVEVYALFRPFIRLLVL